MSATTPAEGKTVLITGSNRGIGYGLAQRFVRGGWHVIATARHPDGARDLWELERDHPGWVELMQLDVTSESDLEAARTALVNRPIQALINNAGVLPGDSDKQDFEATTADAMEKAFAVNVLGPMRLIQTLLPILKKSQNPIVATISSRMGSISDDTSGSHYAYRISKTAANMLMHNLAVDYPGMICLTLHPGWVQTEMGGAGAQLTVSESVDGLFKVITGASMRESGRFFDYRGQEIGW